MHDTQKQLVNVLQYGTALVSVFVLTGSVSDPVNAPKLMILGGVSISALFIVLANLRTGFFREFRVTSYAALIFIVWSVVSSIKSSSPLSQNFYGLYGRNTGLLTYFFLAVLLICSSTLRNTDGIAKIARGFGLAIVINIVYSAWVIFFGDFIGWENPYGAILGTFGNPNFISSFLGMGVGPLLTLIIYGSRRSRVLAVALLGLVGLELTKADSLQGIVVGFVGAGFVICHWLRYKFSSVRIGGAALICGLTAGIVAFAGAIGKGPLTSLMAQPTVALREQYWFAAIQMFKQNPIFGVGMDSYGDWYRRSRGAKALISPGAETVTNVSHNVYLDILSFGGLPLFLSYLSINTIVFYYIFRRFFSAKELDIRYIVISVIWIGFQIQSLISINQIGLAIWGWLFSGLLIAWHYAESEQIAVKERKPLTGVNLVLPIGLIAGIGASLGCFLAVPPLAADMRWMSALKTQSLPKLEQSLDGSYFSPNNSTRLAQAVQTLERSNLTDFALKYARKGVDFNPESTQAWLTLYMTQLSSSEEKAWAKTQLIRLDPLNPKWRELD